MRRAEKLNHLHVPTVFEIWDNLNLLESSGPIQARNGIALPLSRDSVFGIANFCGLDGPEIEFR